MGPPVPERETLPEQFAIAFAEAFANVDMSYRAFATAMSAELGEHVSHSTVRTWIEHGRIPRLPAQLLAAEAVLGVRFDVVVRSA